MALITFDRLKTLVVREGYTITKDDGQYFAANNGKRFYSFQSKSNWAALGIREDGDTRTVFSGFISDTNEFDVIDRTSNPNRYNLINKEADLIEDKGTGTYCPGMG